MSESFKSPLATSSTWSARLAERYRCRLSPVLGDWFDRGIYKLTGRGEYREPMSPDELLKAAPEEIWPGLMSCDLIPLLSNSAGDWLCARMGPDNQMSQIVQWYHGGGDWIPWGNNLAEAIVFDAVVERLVKQEVPAKDRARNHRAARRHAVPAEAPRPDLNADQRLGDPLLRWALEHVPASVASAVERDIEGEDLIAEMLTHHVAEVAVRCELVVAMLTPWPRDTLHQLFRSLPDLDRSQIAQWSFDLSQMPSDIRDQLHQQTGVVGTQDWERAAVHAERVCQVAPDLAWAWEIAGYAAERAGDGEAACKLYRSGSRCSVFTDQSVRLDTHWISHQSAKFSVARLQELDAEAAKSSSYFRLLCHPDANQRRKEATTYWSEKATQFMEQDAPADAHRCFVAAAWDLGAEPISSYGHLLDQIAEAADRSGQESRAEIARTHRTCLRDRYGT